MGSLYHPGPGCASSSDNPALPHPPRPPRKPYRRFSHHRMNRITFELEIALLRSSLAL